MKISGTTLGVLAVLVVVVLFVFSGCSLSCKSGYSRGTREGYKRATLGNQCQGMQRSPVDYAFKNPGGWQRNPHWRTEPSVKYQPLEFGPIDFYADSRRLNENDGVLFQQYRNDWKGCGRETLDMANDEKNRFDLTNVGDQGARVQLDDLYSTRFGPRGITHTERSYDQPNPYFDKIYGGAGWLKHDRLGD